MDLPLSARYFNSISSTFRGEIWEDNPGMPMGKGYSNDNKPFDIEEACYLKPVFRAVKNPNIREVVAKAGVQSLKTFFAEKSIGYLVVHDPGEMAIYDCDIDAARDHAKSRLGPMLRSVPGIREQIEETENRHDITTTEFYLPGMTLRMWPLNLSATQRVTLRYVIIHDAFLAKNTGMIGQAKARTTQHPNNKKVIIESQGSEEGDEFDQEYNSTNQGMLHVRCPHCKEGQPFEFERTRPDDFKPVTDPAFTWEAPKGGTHSGFQRGPDELALLPDGNYNAVEILRNTYYECYHCGGAWRDTPEVRKALDQSSYYVPLNPTADPTIAGFNWPNWINQRIRWGGNEVMMGYLTAKKIYTERGNKDPLRQWYQKRAGKTWSEKLERTPYSIITSTYDPTVAIPNEASRVMKIDCQQGDIPQKTGKFWGVGRAIDRDGKVLKQLFRGYFESWKEWIDVQHALKIPNDNVAIDGGKYLHEILDAAAANFEIVERTDPRNGKKFKARSVWKILIGDGRRKSFPHGKGIFRSFSQPTFYQRNIQVEKGRYALINIPVYRWSNWSVKEHLFTLVAGGPGLPEFIALERDKLSPAVQAKETGDLAYSKQMQNQYRGKDKGRDAYIETSPNVHYADCECGCIVLFDMGGLLGLPAAPDEDAQPAG